MLPVILIILLFILIHLILKVQLAPILLSIAFTKILITRLIRLECEL